MFVGYNVIMFEKKNTTEMQCVYTYANDPALYQFGKSNSRNRMLFLDIKDPAKRTTLVDEYVKAMKTVRQRNMVNRETKLAIGEELQTLFHPIVSATKHAAEKTAEELALVKKALEDIDGTLKAQRRVAIPPPPPPSPPEKDLTFGIHATDDGRNAMGNSIEYELTPGLRMLILYKKP